MKAVQSSIQRWYHPCQEIFLSFCCCKFCPFTTISSNVFIWRLLPPEDGLTTKRQKLSLNKLELQEMLASSILIPVPWLSVAKGILAAILLKRLTHRHLFNYLFMTEWIEHTQFQRGFLLLSLSFNQFVSNIFQIDPASVFVIIFSYL